MTVKGDGGSDRNATAHKHTPAITHDLLTLAFTTSPGEIWKRLWSDTLKNG